MKLRGSHCKRTNHKNAILPKKCLYLLSQYSTSLLPSLVDMFFYFLWRVIIYSKLWSGCATYQCFFFSMYITCTLIFNCTPLCTLKFNLKQRDEWLITFVCRTRTTSKTRSPNRLTVGFSNFWKRSAAAASRPSTGDSIRTPESPSPGVNCRWQT